MDKFLVLKPLIQKTAESDFFKKCFLWFFRVLAALTFIGFIFVSVKLWGNVSSTLPAEVIVIFVIAQLILLFMTFVIINIMLIRADDIAAIPQATDYIVVPVFILILKMTGEILGSIFALVGIIFGIAMMVVKSDAGGLSAIPMVNYFADAGIAAIIVGPMYGLFMLALFHAFAELLTVLVDIARNTKK